MWRLKIPLLLGALVAGLVVGLAVTQGAWWWNARIDVEGSVIRTAWSVVDDPEGSSNYHTTIKVKLPREAVSEVLAEADTEVVFLETSRKLKCRDDGIQTKVSYVVEGLDGATGKRVEVTVYGPEDEVLGENSGKVGKKISLKVVIPNAECSGGH